MSYLDQALQAKKRFQQAIAERAKPDEGINLRRNWTGISGKQAEFERQNKLKADQARQEAERIKRAAQTQRTLDRLLKTCNTAVFDEGLVVTKVNLPGQQIVTGSLQEFSTEIERRFRIKDIQRVVAKRYGLSVNDILSDRRLGNLILPRQIAYYIARQLTKRSLPEIGRAFNGRDHATVLHGVRKIENLMQSNEKLQREISDLINKIKEIP